MDHPPGSSTPQPNNNANKGVMTREELLSKGQDWNLACDNALLMRLQDFSENLVKSSHEITANCDLLSNDISTLQFRLSNVTNEFLMLGNSQFVENCVQEFEECNLNTQNDIPEFVPQTKAEKEAALIDKMKEAIQIGVKHNSQRNEQRSITLEESIAGGSTSSQFSSSVNVAHLIGSSKFFSSKFCGLKNENRPNNDAILSNSSCASSSTSTSSKLEDTSAVAPKIPSQNDIEAADHQPIVQDNYHNVVDQVLSPLVYDEFPEEILPEQKPSKPKMESGMQPKPSYLIDTRISQTYFPVPNRPPSTPSPTSSSRSSLFEDNSIAYEGQSKQIVSEEPTPHFWPSSVVDVPPSDSEDDIFKTNVAASPPPTKIAPTPHHNLINELQSKLGSNKKKMENHSSPPVEPSKKEEEIIKSPEAVVSSSKSEKVTATTKGGQSTTTSTPPPSKSSTPDQIIPEKNKPIQPQAQAVPKEKPQTRPPSISSQNVAPVPKFEPPPPTKLPEPTKKTSIFDASDSDDENDLFFTGPGRNSFKTKSIGKNPAQNNSSLFNSDLRPPPVLDLSDSDSDDIFKALDANRGSGSKFLDRISTSPPPSIPQFLDPHHNDVRKDRQETMSQSISTQQQPEQVKEAVVTSNIPKFVTETTKDIVLPPEPVTPDNLNNENHVDTLSLFSNTTPPLPPVTPSPVTNSNTTVKATSSQNINSSTVPSHANNNNATIPSSPKKNPTIPSSPKKNPTIPSSPKKNPTIPSSPKKNSTIPSSPKKNSTIKVSSSPEKDFTPNVLSPTSTVKIPSVPVVENAKPPLPPPQQQPHPDEKNDDLFEPRIPTVVKVPVKPPVIPPFQPKEPPPFLASDNKQQQQQQSSSQHPPENKLKSIFDSSDSDDDGDLFHTSTKNLQSTKSIGIKSTSQSLAKSFANEKIVESKSSSRLPPPILDMSNDDSDGDIFKSFSKPKKESNQAQKPSTLPNKSSSSILNSDSPQQVKNVSLENQITSSSSNIGHTTSETKTNTDIVAKETSEKSSSIVANEINAPPNEIQQQSKDQSAKQNIQKPSDQVKSIFDSSDSDDDIFSTKSSRDLIKKESVIKPATSNKVLGKQKAVSLFSDTESENEDLFNSSASKTSKKEPTTTDLFNSGESKTSKREPIGTDDLFNSGESKTSKKEPIEIDDLFNSGESKTSEKQPTTTNDLSSGASSSSSIAPGLTVESTSNGSKKSSVDGIRGGGHPSKDKLFGSVAKSLEHLFSARNPNNASHTKPSLPATVTEAVSFDDEAFTKNLLICVTKDRPKIKHRPPSLTRRHFSKSTGHISMPNETEELDPFA